MGNKEAEKYLRRAGFSADESLLIAELAPDKVVDDIVATHDKGEKSLAARLHQVTKEHGLRGATHVCCAYDLFYKKHPEGDYFESVKESWGALNKKVREIVSEGAGAPVSPG